MKKYIIDTTYLDDLDLPKEKPILLNELIGCNWLLHENQTIEIKRKNNIVTVSLKDYQK